MAYIGRTPDIGNFEKQILTPDSVTTTFALTYAVGSANSLYVNYGGVPQEPQVAYSVSGGGQQIVFSEAPVTGTTLYIIYYGKQLTTPRAAGQETTKQTFAGDGSTVTFTLTDPPVVPAGIMVFVDGILQREGSGNNYVSSGSTSTFTSAPDSSAEIDVYTLVKEKVSIDTVADGSITSTKLAAGAPTWNGAGETVIATASTGNSLRITNTGTGNSLLVEDATNPDATSFAIDASGTVLVGTTTAQTIDGITPAYQQLGASNYAGMWLGRYSANSTANWLYLTKSRSATVGTNTIVNSGDDLGTIAFYGADGTNLIPAATILGEVDGTPGTNDMPGRLVFSTTADGASSVTERMRITSAGDVGIGTTSPSTKLHVSGSATQTALISSTAGDVRVGFDATGAYYNWIQTDRSNGAFRFAVSNTEAMRLDTSGNLGIGTASPSSRLEIVGTNPKLTINANDTVNGRNATLSLISGTSADPSGTCQIMYGASNSTSAGTLTFVRGDGTERMRIDASGNVFTGGNYTVAYPGSGNTTTGIFLESSGQLSVSRDNTVVARFNRNSTDGTLLSLSRQGSEIGTVSVSSGTVSYNAFAGSHWSQLSDGSKPDILRGTVLDSINELVQWPDEPTTERLCKVKVSDIAGSKKVYGVFMDWDNDWTATNDMYVTAVGAFICRVNASVTVQEGDLLESNGDGTARVQADDLIRSSTIGKVTCTEKTHQYDDGSYCVPTVLYCG